MPKPAPNPPPLRTPTDYPYLVPTITFPGYTPLLSAWDSLFTLLTEIHGYEVAGDAPRALEASAKVNDRTKDMIAAMNGYELLNEGRIRLLEAWLREKRAGGDGDGDGDEDEGMGEGEGVSLEERVGRAEERNVERGRRPGFEMDFAPAAAGEKKGLGDLVKIEGGED